MIKACDVAAILLAAGLSRRFGPSSKLSAPFRGKPLALHAAQMLDRFDFGKRICVTSKATGPVASAIAALGYRMVEQPHPELGLAASLALGVRRAMRSTPQAVLVVLADMPMVTPRHIANLLDALRDGDDLVASSDSSVAMAPALFGRHYFEGLLQLSGDRGAQHLLADARRIEAAPGELLDIDRPQDAVAHVH